MPTRSTPFDELERLFDRMSRQFEDTSEMWETEDPFAMWARAVSSMAVDLVERDEEFVATVDLPGFERDDVEVEVTDHVLHIEADHEDHHEGMAEEYIRRERRHESASRSIRLPADVDVEGVEARMHNGVLTITLPKLETEAAHQIEIEGV
jgi:HSP20 family protein